MSKLESPMIRRYWEQIGGTLIEEFPVVRQSKTNGPRYVDAIIIPDGEHTDKLRANEVSLKGKDIICVQAKHNRLGMYLIGQALFSIHLLERFEPKSILSVALCTNDDSVLRPLLNRYNKNIMVVIDQE